MHTDTYMCLLSHHHHHHQSMIHLSLSVCVCVCALASFLGTTSLCITLSWLADAPCRMSRPHTMCLSCSFLPLLLLAVAVVAAVAGRYCCCSLLL